MHMEILADSISAKKKNLCFIVYMLAFPTRPPPVMSGLRMLVQLAGPASPIGRLVEQ